MVMKKLGLMHKIVKSLPRLGSRVFNTWIFGHLGMGIITLLSSAAKGSSDSAKVGKA